MLFFYKNLLQETMLHFSHYLLSLLQSVAVSQFSLVFYDLDIADEYRSSIS